MADPRFYKNSGELTLQQILEITNATLSPGASIDEKITFQDVATLNVAGGDAVSFVNNKKYFTEFQQSKAGLVFCLPEFATEAPSSTIVLITSTPYRAYAQIASTFYPDLERNLFQEERETISEHAKIADNVLIERGAVIRPGAEIGE